MILGCTLPPAGVDLLVPFDDFQTAAGVVSAIIARRIVPTTIEFMERDIVHACRSCWTRSCPTPARRLTPDPARRQPQAALDAIVRRCRAVPGAGALDVLVATDRPTRDRLWEARRAIIDSLNHASPVNHMEDLVVPRARIPELLRDIHDLAARLEVRILSFGHAGDGNVHVTVLKDSLGEAAWAVLVPQAREALYRLTLSLVGPDRRHGIGATRRATCPSPSTRPRSRSCAVSGQRSTPMGF